MANARNRLVVHTGILQDLPQTPQVRAKPYQYSLFLRVEFARAINAHKTDDING